MPVAAPIYGWILILFGHVGPMGDGNSNTLAVAYMTSEASCKDAGEAAKKMGKGNTKEILYTCKPR